MNYFGQLFIALSDHLKKQVPELRWIDQDFGQLEVFEYRPNVAFPCVLIDFAAAAYSNLSQLSQVGELTITVRIGFTPFSSAQQSAPMDVRQKALEYYEIEQKVYQALQGFNTLQCQPLMRMSAQTEQRVSASGAQDASGLRVRILSFQTSFEDNSAERQYTVQPANLEIQQEIHP